MTARLTWFPGDTAPNLSGKVAWDSLKEITTATAIIFVGDYATSAVPFKGAVTISNRLEDESGSSFEWSYDVAAVDTVEGTYRVRIRVTYATGEFETIEAGTAVVSEN